MLYLVRHSWNAITLLCDPLIRDGISIAFYYLVLCEGPYPQHDPLDAFGLFAFVSFKFNTPSAIVGCIPIVESHAFLVIPHFIAAANP